MFCLIVKLREAIVLGANGLITLGLSASAVYFDNLGFQGFGVLAFKI